MIAFGSPPRKDVPLSSRSCRDHRCPLFPCRPPASRRCLLFPLSITFALNTEIVKSWNLRTQCRGWGGCREVDRLTEHEKQPLALPPHCSASGLGCTCVSLPPASPSPCFVLGRLCFLVGLEAPSLHLPRALGWMLPQSPPLLCTIWHEAFNFLRDCDARSWQVSSRAFA